MAEVTDLRGPRLSELFTLWILLFVDVLDKEGKVAVFLAKGSVSLVKFLLYSRIAKSVLITHKLLPMLLSPLICLS